jgi:hypothetical protein
MGRGYDDCVAVMLQDKTSWMAIYKPCGTDLRHLAKTGRRTLITGRTSPKYPAENQLGGAEIHPLRGPPPRVRAGSRRAAWQIRKWRKTARK